jgi:hypothetical protein
VVVWQLGYKVPYQLHCEVVAHAELCTELLVEVVGTELDVFTELLVEVAGEELVVATELLVVTVEQTAPVIVGFSAAEPFLSPCTPKLTDWPGWIVLFQSSAVAVYGLLPLRVAFQELVILLAEYCQPTVQPLMAVVPLLVIVMEPWKPVFHSLTTV